ncbi:hypothetical protein M5K25_022179 [Dendrobium thyrsiflorum]|uniref:Uncharacterized protein n=1 Tax=Dendrobium thyrsiflorum TaxID=117978 RepID=A0ABD0U679_DENTH
MQEVSFPRFHTARDVQIPHRNSAYGSNLLESPRRSSVPGNSYLYMIPRFHNSLGSLLPHLQFSAHEVPFASSEIDVMTT